MLKKDKRQILHGGRIDQSQL